MAQQSSELKATARPRAGKGAARQARREGKVPGVIYGDGKPPELDRSRLQRPVETGDQGPLHLDRVRGRGRRQEEPRAPARAAGRSRQGSAHPRRFHAHRQRRPHPRRGGRALHQRGALARPEARRRVEHRAPRHRGHLPLRQDAGLLRGRSHRSRNRPLSAHLVCETARGRRADDQGPRLHDRDDRRRGEAGRGSRHRGGSDRGRSSGRRCSGTGRRRRCRQPAPRARLRVPRAPHLRPRAPRRRRPRAATPRPAATRRSNPHPVGRARLQSSAPARLRAGHSHEALRRTGQPGREIRAPSPQRRLHGDRPYRFAPRRRPVAPALPGRDGGAAASAAIASCC